MSSITVEHLAKSFRIGSLERDTMLREAIVRRLKNPLAAFRERTDILWALKDVCFAVEEGEVLGIIGKNGAGKSTLLKILSKVTYPTKGSIHVGGRVGALLEVGTGFHEELTGRENVFLNGSILGMKKKEIDAKMDAIVDFAGVGQFLETPLKRYSSGMRLRLGFAVAAHLETDVLLIDEVLAVGDAEFQKKCLSAMDGMRDRGRTVIFVSHNMAAIENLCPRTIWIDDGRVREDGSTHEVIQSYLASSVADGGTGMNLEDIEARTGTGEIRFTAIEFREVDGRRKDVIRSGDKLVVRIHYRAAETVKDPYFGFELHTSLGTLVSEVSTWSTRFEIPAVSPGTGYLDLTLDFLNLMPDEYFLTLWSATPGKRDYDVLGHFGRLTVEGSDFYGSGRGIERRFGIVFLPCSWEHAPAEVNL